MSYYSTRIELRDFDKDRYELTHRGNDTFVSLSMPDLGVESLNIGVTDIPELIKSLELMQEILKEAGAK
tara:strand:- start:3692 stop:3898 length:207 start_codon:yes stop_codon:yes gene_type:complete